MSGCGEAACTVEAFSSPICENAAFIFAAPCARNSGVSGGMSTKRMRVPCVGGGNISGPSVGSAPLSTAAGDPVVHHTSWKTVPGMALSSTTVGSGPWLATMALPCASWPVTVRWMGGKLMVACGDVGSRRSGRQRRLPSGLTVRKPTWATPRSASCGCRAAAR